MPGKKGKKVNQDKINHFFLVFNKIFFLTRSRFVFYSKLGFLFCFIFFDQIRNKVGKTASPNLRNNERA
jgi:hypothetical protein